MEIQSLAGTVTAAYPAPSHAPAHSNQSANAQPLSGAPEPATPNVGGTVTAEAPKPVSTAPRPEEVKQSVEKINKTIQSLDRNLQFTVDEDTKLNVVKVVDTDTKKVIRQFPSEEALAIAKALDKLQGLLFTDKA